MKRIHYILLAVALLCSSAYGKPAAGPETGSDSLVLLSTPGLKDLVSRWSEEYKNATPGKTVSVREVESISFGHPDFRGQVAFVHEKGISSNDTGIRLVVGRDVVVPVVNASNPFLEEIREKGVAPRKMKLLMEDQPTWGDLLGGAQGRIVKFHYLDDPFIISAMTGFTGADKAKISGVQHAGADELINSLLSDIYSVGFCRLEDIRAVKELSGKIAILPVDRNGNGKMDANEDIYNDLSAFARGIWIGKYPRELYSNIYTVTTTPVNENVSDFLNWLITEGQNMLPAEGYSGLILTERISGAARIAEAIVPVKGTTGEANIFRTLLLALAVLAAAILVTSFLVSLFRRKTVTNAAPVSPEEPFLDEKSVLLPKGVYFDKTHTWAFMEVDGNVKVGVDDFLLHMTGPLNRVKMKNSGDRIKKGEEILSVIRNGKQLNLYSPVTGIIREKNSELESDVTLLNSSPYGSGWVYRVEPENWQRENQLLFMAGKHREFIMNEITRIKDFFAGLFREANVQYAPLVLQDGGMLHDGVLSEMSPEVWEEFQTKIIDPSRTVWFYEII